LSETVTIPDIGNGSEGLKHFAENVVHVLGATGAVGNLAMELAGVQVSDSRLQAEIAGVVFENPLMVGAGWDKTGRCVDGLYMLGFAGTEVGTVPPLAQPGNPKPRLFTDSSHSVSLNRMGFNSPGAEAVAANLERQRRAGVVGINLGKNKDTPLTEADADHARSAAILGEYASYLVINPSSPNTPGLRRLLDPRPLSDNIAAVSEVSGGLPIFIKTNVDLSLKDLDGVLEVCVNSCHLGVVGVIDTNTTVDEALKARYGWQGQPGGVSGNDAEFRQKAVERMKHITHETKGTGLHRIGVGGIHDVATAIERLQAGAEIIQVVTAIRHRRGLVAGRINRGILAELDHLGLHSVGELVGMAT
jgi:dihydroorotate dehydrogenase